MGVKGIRLSNLSPSNGVATGLIMFKAVYLTILLVIDASNLRVFKNYF